MREKLNKIYSQIESSKFVYPPETKKGVEKFLSLYAELDDIEKDLAAHLEKLEEVERAIEVAEREYSHAWSEYENEKDDTGNKYLAKYINARDYWDTERHELKRKKDELEEEIESLQAKRQGLLSKLPSTPAEEEEIIDEILEEIEDAITESQKNLDALKEQLNNEGKVTGTSQPGEED